MTSKFQTAVTAAVGAIVLSTSFLAAAAGPAVAIERAPVATYSPFQSSLSARASA